MNFRKNIYFCFTDYTKAFDCVDCNKLCKILQEVGIPDHLTCLLRNLYGVQEATEPDMEQQTGSKLGKEYIEESNLSLLNCRQILYRLSYEGRPLLSPSLFNLHAEYILQNAGLEDSQAGIKIARRNIKNLGYADNTTLLAEVNRN